ncbi:MAG: DUF4417 domain-containing protein, partial [Victivallales bacterium]|nr:DUF4417 domain-containing protein [Victivallales bacterium]
IIYQFICNPQKYLPALKKRPCVFSLDLSTFQELPLPIVRFNIYLNRLYTQELQKQGVNTIPAIQWRDRKSFDFCFLGIPQGCPIAFSTIGVNAYNVTRKLWQEGVTEALRQIHPPVVFIHGDPIKYDFGSVEVRYLANQIIRRFRKNGR